MNRTIINFGYPETLIAEYEHWLVLLRPTQPTLGSVILAAKSDATAFSELEPAAVAGLKPAIDDTEAALRSAVEYEKINYLMLMMVDPHVHFHVLPRYEGERSACGVTVRDAGWPKVPMLGEAVALPPGQIGAAVEWLRSCWPTGR